MHFVLQVVGHSDARLSGRMRGWRPPRWLRLWMIWATRLGDGWAWLLVAALSPFGDDPHPRSLIAGLLAAVLTNALQLILKRRFRRRRPCEEGPSPFFDVKPPDCFSFPSGHAMNAFALASLLTLQFPLLGPALALIAGSIAASRVVLGLHYVSDVMVGAMLGTAVGVSVSLTVLS